jgi:hypothetical protein
VSSFYAGLGRQLAADPIIDHKILYVSLMASSKIASHCFEGNRI